jgi:hypothetical protein
MIPHKSSDQLDHHLDQFYRRKVLPWLKFVELDNSIINKAASTETVRFGSWAGDAGAGDAGAGWGGWGGKRLYSS